nr:exonuclease domain-containing protein [Psychromicrobium silvestre]
MDFTAIDFETANGFRGSPCAVGLSRVRGGRIVEEAFWLMRPPAGHDHFDPRNIEIHGVTPQQVASQPRFGEVFGEITDFLGADVLVAHNAAFDTGVIKAALQASARPGPAFAYACTVILARRSYSLPSYSLPFVAEAAGVPLIHHHDAIEDARACAGIMIDIAGIHGAESIEQLYQAMSLSLPVMEAFQPDLAQLDSQLDSARLDSARTAPLVQNSSWLGWPEEGANPEPNISADRNHPLYGQTVVFTGNLQIPRSTAKVRAAEVGARPASSVTAKTTVLVVGDGFIAADLRRGDTSAGRVTTKARRVLELHGKGQQIEVLSEGEFMQMIG